MADRREREAEFWNRIADFYDRYVEKEYGTSYKRFRKLFFKYVKRKHTVLDVATGTGDIAFVLARRAKVVKGIDISEGMIREARSRTGDNPEFLIDDAYKMEFKRGSFDLVTCCNGLNVMKEPETALMEMRRVLKSRGRLVTITYCWADATLGQRLGLLGRRIRVGWPGFSRSLRGPELRAMHSEAGFKILRCDYVWKDPPAVLVVARRP